MAKQLNERDQAIIKLLPHSAKVAAPIALYCALSDCQTLIHVGEPIYRVNGATFVHISCPKTPMRNFAPHKHPDTGMVFGG